MYLTTWPLPKKNPHWKRNVLFLMHPIVYYVKENNEKYHGTFPLRKYHWVFYCRLQMQPSYRGVHKSTEKEYSPEPWYFCPDSEGTIASMYNEKDWRNWLNHALNLIFRPVMSKHYRWRPNGCRSQKIRESLENSKNQSVLGNAIKVSAPNPHWNNMRLQCMKAKNKYKC